MSSGVIGESSVRAWISLLVDGAWKGFLHNGEGRYRFRQGLKESFSNVCQAGSFPACFQGPGDIAITRDVFFTVQFLGLVLNISCQRRCAFVFGNIYYPSKGGYTKWM